MGGLKSRHREEPKCAKALKGEGWGQVHSRSPKLALHHLTENLEAWSVFLVSLVLDLIKARTAYTTYIADVLGHNWRKSERTRPARRQMFSHLGTARRTQLGSLELETTVDPIA